MRRLALVASLSAAITLGALSGCGNPQDRQAIMGAVTLKGQPIEDGIINFAPLDGQATGEGAQIVKGKYQIPRDKGLSPGKYRVAIYAGDGTSGVGNASPDPPIGGGKPGKERVPPDYNEKSKIVKEVVRRGPNQFDFDIP